MVGMAIKISIIENLSIPGLHKMIEMEEGREYHLRLIEMPKMGDQRDRIPFAVIPIAPNPKSESDLITFLTKLEKGVRKARIGVEGELRRLKTCRSMNMDANTVKK